MTYQLVLMSFGQSEEKKIMSPSTANSPRHSSALKDGRRWVLDFINGKVAKVHVY